MKNIKRYNQLFEEISQVPKNPIRISFKRTITVSFQIPDELNSPGYWTTYEGEPLLTYKGPGITDSKFLKIIADSNGDLKDEFQINNEILEELGWHLTLEDISEFARRSNGVMSEFEKIASAELFNSFEEDLYQCSDVLDDGEDSIPFFKDYYKVSVE